MNHFNLSSQLVTLVTLAMVFISSYVVLRDTSLFQDQAGERDIEYYHVHYVQIFSGVKGGLYSHLEEKRTGKRINIDYYPFEQLDEPELDDLVVGVVPRSSMRFYDMAYLKIADREVIKAAYGLADINQDRSKSGSSYLIVLMLALALVLGLTAYGKRN